MAAVLPWNRCAVLGKAASASGVRIRSWRFSRHPRLDESVRKFQPGHRLLKVEPCFLAEGLQRGHSSKVHVIFSASIDFPMNGSSRHSWRGEILDLVTLKSHYDTWNFPGVPGKACPASIAFRRWVSVNPEAGGAIKRERGPMGLAPGSVT